MRICDLASIQPYHYFTFFTQNNALASHHPHRVTKHKTNIFFFHNFIQPLILLLLHGIILYKIPTTIVSLKRSLKLYKLEHNDRWSMHDVNVPVISSDYINKELTFFKHVNFNSYALLQLLWYSIVLYCICTLYNYVL